MGKLAILGATFLWGLWGFCSHQAVLKAHPFTIQWLFAIPYALMAPVWYYLSRQTGAATIPNKMAIFWSITACSASILAVLLYNTAMKLEKASLVVSLSSAYPLVTVFLLVLTHQEAFRWQQIVAFCLIMAGVIVLQINPNA